MFVLPVADTGPPCSASRGLFRFELGFELLHNLIKLLENAFHVADDRDIWDAVLTDFGGIDIHMNDAGVTGEGLELAGDAIVETSAEGDEKVALGHAHVGGVTAVHARHADEIRMAGGQAA